MCGNCLLVLGTFVGGAALLKVGGFGGAKTAIVAMMANRVFWRK